MSATTQHNEAIKNPGSYQIPSGLKSVLSVLALVGVITFVIGFSTDAKRMWPSFLQNHFFFMSLALGGMFFAALQWMTGAMWSAPVRRLAESFTAFLPWVLGGLLLLYFGRHELYRWTDASFVKGDIILEGKAGYLSVPFFFIRNAIAVLLWIFFAKKMIGNSIAQDQSKDPALTVRNRTLSPGFLILFALTFTMVSFDLVMSLDPYWFSTMFGVYCFAGLFYSTLAATTLMAIYLRRKGALVGIVNDNHLHDLGKFMFAFTVFWAYIGFSQFMLIWYANMPEETGYFITRMKDGWYAVSVFLLVGKFATPFFFLLPRGSKRSEKMLWCMGWFMLIAQWIDVMWMVQPEFYAHAPRFGWMEAGITLGFIGAFGLVVFRFLARNNIVAIGDPRLAESVHHHHQ